MKRKKHFKYYACVTIFFFCPTLYAETNKQKTNNQDDENDYVFDPSVFKGEYFNQSAIETLSRPNTLLPGTYQLDTYLNKRFMGNFPVEVTNNNTPMKTCLPLELIKQIGFKKLNFDASAPNKCYTLSEISPESSAKIDNSALKLYLNVPQIFLDLKPQGYVNPNNYDTGSNIGFVNYLANYYHVNFNGNQKNLDSAWFSLQGGINLASWQYRQQSNLTWSSTGGAKWRNNSRYVQRPIVSLESQLMVGQLVTNSVFLSGMNYTGINLHSSDAMLPDSQRGYAPIITGIANSNATVTVSQNGQSIYQTTVPSGAFTINDLYPTSYSGDLTVTIKEADGSEKSFAVPYSSLPESIRPGLSRYNLAVGKTRDTVKKANFVDLVYQRGLSNTISSNQAIRVAPNYLATMLGGVYSSPLGSIGLDGTFSRATLDDDSRKQGWMAHISWSKVVEASSTSITLAGYRYSSSGYRDLVQILGMNNDYKFDLFDSRYEHNQRERFDISLNQNLWSYGSLTATGSVQKYRDGSPKDTQMQLGYSKFLSNGINMNIAVTRQLTGTDKKSKQLETATSISLSIPLMPESAKSLALSTSYNHSDSGGDQYQLSAAGTLDDETNSTYSLSTSSDTGMKFNNLSGTFQRQLSNMQVGLSASTGQAYWQASGNIQGALALHSGGLTFGPYLGNTFALVEAKGAEGTKISGGYRNVIDSRGYALIPSLVPYHNNSILLNSDNLSGNTELIDSQKYVAPVAGAGVKVVFRTRHGYALLINTRSENGKVIPIGSEVYDNKNNLLGIAGQGGQIYVRVPNTAGSLKVKWSGDKQPCRINFNLNNNQTQQALINIKASCMMATMEKAAS